MGQLLPEPGGSTLAPVSCSLLVSPTCAGLLRALEGCVGARASPDDDALALRTGSPAAQHGVVGSVGHGEDVWRQRALIVAPVLLGDLRVGKKQGGLEEGRGEEPDTHGRGSQCGALHLPLCHRAAGAGRG